MKAQNVYNQILKVKGQAAILERMLQVTGNNEYGLIQQLQQLQSYFYACESIYANLAATELLESTKPRSE